MNPGQLCKSDLTSVWKNSARHLEPGIRLGVLQYGDLVMIIDVSHFEAKIITFNGVIGWVEKKFLYKIDNF
jgi:hypothetical protein